MRHSYGIIDHRKILVHKPQLFKKTDDILVFPSKEFFKWHSEITEYMDGIYQINAKNLEKGRWVDVEDLNLALGLLFNINHELENIFNQIIRWISPTTMFLLWMPNTRNAGATITAGTCIK